MTGKALKIREVAIAAGLGAAGYASAVHAHDFGQLNQTLTVRYSDTAASTSGSFMDSWLAMVTATQNAQPHWMPPLVTATPQLEQEFRADFDFMTRATARDQQLLGRQALQVERARC